MEFFKTTLDYAAVVGEREPQPGESRFNWRNVTVLIIFGVNFISAFAYLLLDLSSYFGYTICTFGLLTCLCAWIGFFLMTLKIGDIFRAVRTFQEKIVNGEQII